MNRWEEQFANHPIHETLQWLDESASKEFNDIDENEVPEKRRFLKIIRKFKGVFKNIDPEIIPFSKIDTLNNALRHPDFANQINAYANDGRVERLVNASNLLTNHLSSLFLFIGVSKKESKQDKIKDLEYLIDSTTETLIGKKDELVEDILKIQASLRSNEQVLEKISMQIEQKRTELNAIVSEWQGQFSSAQETRSQEFSKWRDNFSSEKNSEIDRLVQEYNNQLDSSSSDFDKRIDLILTDGKEKHQAILDLYEITAGDSVGAGYLNSANTEKKQADNWRIISVIFISLSAFWLLFAYFYNTSHLFPSTSIDDRLDISNASNEFLKNYKELSVTNSGKSFSPKSVSLPWYALFATFSLSGVLLWGSAYAAQQSTKHRNNEKRTRWFALEVKAIDPFLSSLEPKERNDLKKQLCERIFGQFINGNNDNTKVIDEYVFKTIADTFGTLLSKIPK